MRIPVLTQFLAFMLLLSPTTALAQPARQSYFGIVTSFSPESKANDELKIVFDVERIDVKSRDFEIGFIVRGRELGGDWGVSYVQKNYKKGSTLDDTDLTCFSTCIQTGNFDIMQDVRLRGLSVHKFAPFVTIKQRAQIGLTFSGGVAWAKGVAERHDFGVDSDNQGRFTQREDIYAVDAKELFIAGYSPVPLFKLEVTGAFIVAPGLKIRAGGGINFTNYPEFSVGASYLFGATR